MKRTNGRFSGSDVPLRGTGEGDGSANGLGYFDRKFRRWAQMPNPWLNPKTAIQRLR
jgi:hypothetical protein